jgi:hypothetical protein
MVEGATASGIENPNSKAHAYNKFRTALTSICHNRLLTILGEVDIGFVIWYRAKKYHTEVSEMLDLAIRNYVKFLGDAVESGEHILVISTPLPTITDGNRSGQVADLRREVQATQQQRTQLTLEFNGHIRDYCIANGLPFLDLGKTCLDENGFVRKELRNPNPLDHHYNRDEYARILCRALRGLL